MEFSKVMAIDGPSGSGKSTIAKQIAAKLNLLYVDTGAMFRGIAYTAKEAEIDFSESEKMTNFLRRLDFKYRPSEEVLIQVNGQDLTQVIRQHEVSALASSISKLPSVREKLLNIQRDIAANNICVMEGRDIGTVVFPDAFCKIFLSANSKERANRRLKELVDKGEGGHLTLESMIRDIEERDQQDSERAIAPLKKARDAIEIDTSGLPLDEVLLLVEKTVRKRGKDAGIEL